MSTKRSTPGDGRRRELSRRGPLSQLAVIVVAPAIRRPVLRQRAGVVGASGDGGDLPRQRAADPGQVRLQRVLVAMTQLAARVRSPAGEAIAAPTDAGVAIAGGQGQHVGQAAAGGPVDDAARAGRQAAVVVAPAAQLRAAVVHQDGHRGGQEAGRARVRQHRGVGRNHRRRRAGQLRRLVVAPAEGTAPARPTAQNATLPPASPVTPDSGAPPSCCTSQGASGPVPASPQQCTRPSWMQRAGRLDAHRQGRRPPGQVDARRRRHPGQPGTDEWPVAPAGHGAVVVQGAGVAGAGRHGRHGAHAVAAGQAAEATRSAVIVLRLLRLCRSWPPASPAAGRASTATGQGPRARGPPPVRPASAPTSTRRGEQPGSPQLGCGG